VIGPSGTERDTDQRPGARPNGSEQEGVSPLASAEDTESGGSGNGAVRRAGSKPNGRADEGRLDPGASMRRNAKSCGSLESRFGRQLDIQRQPDPMFRTQVLCFNGDGRARCNRQYEHSGQARTYFSK